MRGGPGIRKHRIVSRDKQPFRHGSLPQCCIRETLGVARPPLGVHIYIHTRCRLFTCRNLLAGSVSAGSSVMKVGSNFSSCQRQVLI